MTDVPDSFTPVQQESLQYNNPTSEATMSGIGGPINGLLHTALPIGSVVDTLLTEIQFQAQIGNPIPATWVLADGRDVTGSRYQSITSQTNIPDLRGIFRRGKNDGRSDGNQNPDGDLSLGAFTTSRFANHSHGSATGTESVNHTHTLPGGLGVNTQFVASGSDVNVWRVGSTASTGIESASHTHAISAQGGNDTAPSNVTVNVMIRIN